MLKPENEAAPLDPMPGADLSKLQLWTPTIQSVNSLWEAIKTHPGASNLKLAKIVFGDAKYYNMIVYTATYYLGSKVFAVKAKA